MRLRIRLPGLLKRSLLCEQNRKSIRCSTETIITYSSKLGLISPQSKVVGAAGRAIGKTLPCSRRTPTNASNNGV